MSETFSNSKENDEYFNLVNQIITNEKQNCNNSKNKYKNWKESQLKFLDKQNKNGIDWYKELYDLIKRKKIQNENKFIFFWSKFELKTKPNCLNQSSSMFLSNSLNSSHSNSGEKQNTNYNNSSNNINF